MKKFYFSAALSLFFLFPVIQIQAQSKVSGFTGNWVLDKEKSRSKNFPQKLKNYKMVVGETEVLLNVKSQVEGPVEIEVSRDRAPSGPGVVANPQGRTSSPSPTGVSATTAAAEAVEERTYGGTLALFFTPNEISYNLNGEESRVEIKQGDKVNGVARIKAKVDKNGKSVQFTTIRKTKTPKGEVEVITREWWKLSEDGNSLKLQRTVEMPAARDEITLNLKKVAL